MKVLDYTKKNGGWFKINRLARTTPAGSRRTSSTSITDDYDRSRASSSASTGPLGYICIKQ